MNEQLIFEFTTDISKISIPKTLNNPFGSIVPGIAKIASHEFQEHVASASERWSYDFKVRPGKMFGILVVEKKDGGYGFLGTVSGVIDRDTVEPHFVPPVFDNATGDYFINKGMTELTEIGILIKQTNDPLKIKELKEKRKHKSHFLQRQLFEHTHFLNVTGKTQSVSQIFDSSSHGKPPSAAGECAAPKLLQYALKHNLKPIAIAEFWWGNSLKTKEREHLKFYPACKNKCRPILEYMLDDKDLFRQASSI
ncbi:MAG: pseudouridylate synthase [Ekhidna sp.]